MIQKLRVEVTEEDIARGERMSCTRCPVALAVRRALEAPEALERFGVIDHITGWPEIKVGNFKVTVLVTVLVGTCSLTYWSAPLPAHVTKMIGDFDLTFGPVPSMVPHTFDLEFES